MIQRVFWLFYIVIVTFQTGTTFEAFFAKMRRFYNAKQCFFFAENPGCTAPGQPSAAGSGEFLGLLRCRN